MSNAKAFGDVGEQLARDYLQKQGMEILETRYRYGRGEIDIVVRDGEVLVFCEVKTRHSDEFGPPESAVTLRKQAQLKKIAEAYLYEHEIREQICRFDVVAIRMNGNVPHFRHFKNAFW